MSTVPKKDGRDGEEGGVEEKSSTSEAVRTAGTVRTREESVLGGIDEKLSSKDREEPQQQVAEEAVAVSMC